MRVGLSSKIKAPSALTAARWRRLPAAQGL